MSKILEQLKEDEIFAIEKDGKVIVEGCEWNRTTLELPEGVHEIEDNAFTMYPSLQKVFLPSSVEEIGEESFSFCKKLKEVSISSKLKKISADAFKGDSELTTVVFRDKEESKLEIIEKNCFLGCVNLKAIELPNSLKKISDSALRRCSSLEELIVPKGVTEIGGGAFEECSNLKKVVIQGKIEQIEAKTFSKCTSLEYLSFPASVTYIENMAFLKCPFKYVSLTVDGRLLLTKDYPTEQCKEICDVEKLNSTVSLETVAILLKNGESFENILAYSEIAIKNKTIEMPFFLQKLSSCGMLENFVKECNFSEIGKIFDIIATNHLIAHQITAVMIFAYNIGCFSSDREMRIRASNWLLERMQPKTTKNGMVVRDIQILYDFEQMKYWQPYGENREFSEFLFSKSDGKRGTVFQEMCENGEWFVILNKIYIEYLKPRAAQGTIIRDPQTKKLCFKVAKKLKNSAGDELLKIKILKPTVKLFCDYLFKNAFYGAETEEEKKLAREIFKWHGLTQEHFDESKKILNDFHERGMDTNIVGEHLTATDTILKQYQEKTEALEQESMQSAMEITQKMGEIAEKEFFFDWLEKDDIILFTLGMYCHCCATINNAGYGIVNSHFHEPNVQTLIVRNKKGDPVLKSTAFVNTEQGYIVFNNIEFNPAYAQKHKELFDEYMRGILKFVDVYNKKHTEKPITKVSVGMGHNKLNEYIEENYPRISPLPAVDFSKYGTTRLNYGGDWKGCQHLLWQDLNKQKTSEKAD